MTKRDISIDLEKIRVSSKSKGETFPVTIRCPKSTYRGIEIVKDSNLWPLPTKTDAILFLLDIALEVVLPYVDSRPSTKMSAALMAQRVLDQKAVEDEYMAGILQKISAASMNAHTAEDRELVREVANNVANSLPVELAIQFRQQLGISTATIQNLPATNES